METRKIEDVSGIVSKLHFQKPDFCTGKLTTADYKSVSFSVKGFVKPGEPVTLRGSWETHKKYGPQFAATEIVYTVPTTLPGLALWLRWNIQGIGSVKAQKLVDEFGMQLPELAGSDPQQVAIFAGITLEEVTKIADAWSGYNIRCAVLSELGKLGLTQNQSEILFGRFKGSILTILQTDPYLLLREVHGFGWKTVDDIAQKLGFPKDHPGRMRAAVISAVADSYGNGYTTLYQPAALTKATEMLDLPTEPALEGVVLDAEELGKIHRIPVKDSFSLSTPESYRHEKFLWGVLKGANARNPHVGPEVADRVTTVGDKTLDETQRAAIRMIASNRLTVVTGGAGSGKTTIAKAIYKMFTDANISVSLVAPTGKAARRMEDVIGRGASTIHRFLGYRPDGGFMHNAHNQVSIGVVLCDEISMVDSSLAYHLLSACGNNTAVIGIGDPNQLPPVGAGALLRDVIDYNLAPVAKLGVCHRQAGALKNNCHAILEGRIEPTVVVPDGETSPWLIHEGIDTPEMVVKAVKKLWTEHLRKWDFDPLRDVQFLTAMHKGPCGTKFLNLVCQKLHQATLENDLPEPNVGEDVKPVLYEGDKVIHTKNNYTLDVMNGTQGIVVDAGPRLTVKYEDREVLYPPEFKSEVELAYVLTPHKGQGSEWPCAVVICPARHSFMQTTSWIYTACTRAQKTCIVMGDGIRRAAANNVRDDRQTCLQAWAQNPGSQP